MNRHTRRAALAGSLAAMLLVLTACNGETVAQVTAQVLADVTGIVTGLQGVLPKVPATLISPSALAVLTGDLSIAQDVVGKLTTVTPAVQGATALQTAENYVNQVLDALSVVTPELAIAYPPLAAAIPIIAAASALLPAVEAFVNSFIASTAAASRASTGSTAMTPAQARAVLGVATLS